MSQISHNLLYEDKELLEHTTLPIITVSASFKEDLKGFYHRPENDQLQDIVFSRAHFSMALAVAIKAWGEKLDPSKAWLVDPTNHVSEQQWSSVQLTDIVGRTIARWPILKSIKDLIDEFARSKLPILDSITPATLFLTSNIKKPILSFHIATGNILAQAGRPVLEMITDPHVRSDYLINAAKANIKYLVFDEATKEAFFKLAKQEKIKIPQAQLKDKVIVTGPPVDPRIITIGRQKPVWDGSRPLRVVVTTGGLGTNKTEIKQLLQQLLPAIKANDTPPNLELIYYAGTHLDHQQMAIRLAKRYHLRYRLLGAKDPAPFNRQGNWQQKIKTYSAKSAIKFGIIYHPQIIDANELLIRHGFPWADVFITKPSGDMAYDAALSGAALLTLKEWGEWEYNVRHVFEEQQMAQVVDHDHIVQQLQQLGQSAWITQAMEHSHHLPALFYQGVDNIIKAAHNF